MSRVYMMVTITNRGIGSRMLSFYKENGLSVILSTLGAGRGCAPGAGPWRRRTGACAAGSGWGPGRPTAIFWITLDWRLLKKQ